MKEMQNPKRIRFTCDVSLIINTVSHLALLKRNRYERMYRYYAEMVEDWDEKVEEGVY